MRHKIRDIIILLIDILGVSVLYRALLRKKGPLVRVICFHDVADQSWFRSVMQLLKEDYHVLTPSEFHEKKFDPEKINVLITFDDGYQSWIDNCVPILGEFNFKAIFFINSGLIDIAEDEVKVATFMQDRLLISSKKALTWEGARRLVESGHTIGGHTRTHARLSDVAQDIYPGEIAMDKKTIEEKTGRKIDDFAYPFGKRADRTKTSDKFAQNAGYKFIYTTDAAFFDLDAVDSIPRICIEKGQTSFFIKLWACGAYDLFLRIKLVVENKI